MPKAQLDVLPKIHAIVLRWPEHLEDRPREEVVVELERSWYPSLRYYTPIAKPIDLASPPRDLPDEEDLTHVRKIRWKWSRKVDDEMRPIYEIDGMEL